MSVRPLEGIRVVDLTHVLAGPYCTYQLGLLGAEIVKVEVPGGEWLRHQGPPGAGRDAGLGAGFLAQSAGKRMIAVDIRAPEGAEIVRALARTCDVFVENLTPGVAAGAGLGDAALRTLNPRLIYASITGFGQDGPFAGWPAYDHIVQAMSGLMSLTGTPESGPLRVGPPVVDYLTGLHAAFAIMAALAARERDGGFQRVDIAMRDCAFAAMSSVISAHVNAGVVPKAAGNIPASDSPSAGVFDTADGKLALAANTERQFERLCAVLERPDWLRDPRFATRPERARHAPALRVEIAQALAARGAAEWEALLMQADVPAGRVRTLPEAVAEPHTEARGMLRRLDSHTLMGTAFKLNGAPFAPAQAPRAIGTDTEAVLGELGYDGPTIDGLVRSGVIEVAR
ncbi:MAG: CoA transferase [Alphaproteobacteria bacterium]|nr:CoA transferase [Alphaproteobacteria bacterium]